MRPLLPLLVGALALAVMAGAAEAKMVVHTFPLPSGSGAHDVWPAPDGTVWFTAQAAGKLGHLDPRTGRVDQITLGRNSAPHGVIVGPDGAPWVTDGGQNAILRVDPLVRTVKVFPLPSGSSYANLNTATFDRSGRLWFTGQSGIYGRLDPRNGAMAVFIAPRGAGPYGITTTPEGAVFYASLAGSYLGAIDLESGAAIVLEPPVEGQGARRVWSDGRGMLWISGWNSGDLFRYDPKAGSWSKWHLPGKGPRPYAVYVDDSGAVWLSDWGANALVRFDPRNERFETFPLPDDSAGVRQIAGRKGEVWAAESAVDKLVLLKEE